MNHVKTKSYFVGTVKNVCIKITLIYILTIKLYKLNWVKAVTIQIYFNLSENV